MAVRRSIILPLLLIVFPSICFVQSFHVSSSRRPFHRGVLARHAFSTWHISSVIVDDILSNAIPLPSSVTVPTHTFEKQSRQWISNGRLDVPLLAALACLSWSLEPSVAEHIAHTTSLLWDHSSTVLAEHPIASKAASFATVYALGDVVAQTTTTGFQGDLDRDRIVRSLLVGLMVHCPMSYLWCHICDAFFTDTLHLSPTGWILFPRILIDQTIWGPLWNKSYLGWMGVMKGEQMDVVWDNVQKSPIPVLQSSHKSAAHLVTYALIPPESQRLWMDVVELLWVAVLSTRAAGLGASQDSVVDPTNVAPLPPIAVQ